LARSCFGNSHVANAELETLEHAGEIVRVPAVPEYQRHGDCPGVLIRPKVTRRSAQQLLKVVVDVQLLENSLDQRACPSDSLRGGNRSAN
jgi:hypothetical protein